jgi:hypothetical protein
LFNVNANVPDSMSDSDRIVLDPASAFGLFDAMNARLQQASVQIPAHSSQLPADTNRPLC